MKIDSHSSSWIHLPRSIDISREKLMTAYAVGWEASINRNDLKLQKVPIKRLRNNSDCKLTNDNFLYCVEADAAFYDVKIFISLSKIRILFCIFEIQLMKSILILDRHRNTIGCRWKSCRNYDGYS